MTAAQRKPEAARNLARQLVLTGEPFRANEKRGGGNFPAARFWFTLASQVDPTYDRPEVELGSIHFYRGLYDEAAEHFHEAQRRDPRNPSTLNQLGETYLKLGRIDEARPLLRAGRRAPSGAGGAAPESRAGRTSWPAGARTRSAALEAAIQRATAGLRGRAGGARGAAPARGGRLSARGDHRLGARLVAGPRDAACRRCAPAWLEALAAGLLLAAAVAMRVVNPGVYSGLFDEGIRVEQLYLMSAGYRPFRDIFAAQGPLLLDLLHPWFVLFGQDLVAARWSVGVYSLVGLAGRVLAGAAGRRAAGGDHGGVRCWCSARSTSKARGSRWPRCRPWRRPRSRSARRSSTRGAAAGAGWSRAACCWRSAC